ncbi:hypothetical protein E4T56_gene14704 [Termitomyces sp. T112]|nr:hypothetical protein E4T56_gene14704 [Termitomyces sp. T112]
MDFRSSFVTSPALKARLIFLKIESAVFVSDSDGEHLVVRASWSSQTCCTGTALPCHSFKQSPFDKGTRKAVIASPRMLYHRKFKVHIIQPVWPFPIILLEDVPCPGCGHLPHQQNSGV